MMASKTDAELLAEAQALDKAYAEAAAFDARMAAKADTGPKLDAYGHLSFCVGEKDGGWMVCFDAIRVHDGIAYHVVYDTGNAVDTAEVGTVPATEDGIRNLLCIPDYWHNIGLEHNLDMDDDQLAQCETEWAAHLQSLLAEPAPEPPPEIVDQMDELLRAALNHRGEP